jgi:hypothetical protein
MNKIILMILLAIPTIALAGTDRGGGGAGIKRGGVLMSFYSAGLYVEPVSNEDVPYSPPGLSELIRFTQNFPYWGDNDKSKLITTAIPSRQHKYYKVKADQFDETTRNRIIAEFERVTKQPVDDIHLFAITDIERGQTFLFPDFFKIQNPADQVAIIFHENYWLLKGQSIDYQDVVGAELAFQAVYEQPNNGIRIMDLISRYGSQSKSLDVAAKIDLDQGNLKDIVKNGVIPMRDLLGDGLKDCNGHCVEGMLSYRLVQLVEKYPHSLILRRMLSNQQDHGMRVTYKVNHFTMRKDTPIGWIFFPSTDTDSYRVKLEDLVLKETKQAFDIAKCDLDLNVGKVGKLSCHGRARNLFLNF